MERQFELKLATNDQVLQAKQTLQQAQLKPGKHEKAGNRRLANNSCRHEGVDQKCPVQEGAIVAAGNPLVEIVAQNRLEVRLGVDRKTLTG